MITTEEAIVLATRHLEKTFPDFTANDLRLEEIESPVVAGRWILTFSSAVPPDPSGSESLLSILRLRRRQKSVELESETGVLVSVRNKAA